MNRRLALNLLSALVLDRWWQDYKRERWPDMDPAQRERARPRAWRVHLDQVETIEVEYKGQVRSVSVSDLFDSLNKKV